MTRQTWGAGLVAACLIGAPAGAFAQGAEEITAAPAELPEEEDAPAAEAQPETIKAIVRGAYVEAKVGGGYMVVNDDVEPTAAYPQASGSERLGGGSTVQLAVGYDLADMIAVQVIGGAILASGGAHIGTRGREDLVRDLSMLFGGGGARVTVEMRSRLNMVASVGVGYVTADNALEEPDTGVAGFGSIGLEYYVHVRHFSVGLEMHVFAPVSPLRLFVGLTPQIKYTF